jgi:hypothetical protein
MLTQHAAPQLQAQKPVTRTKISKPLLQRTDTMNKHQLTYIDMHPQPIKTRYTLSDYLGAVFFAFCIGAPFAAFFIIYGA